MDFWVGVLVDVVQLALAGFVMWGGWLCLSTWLMGENPQAGAAPSVATRGATPQSFERVASLVLLALLFTA